MTNGLSLSGTARPDAQVEYADPDDVRQVLRRFATGVTVVSAWRDIPHGMTANAFTSVALSPPLVLICVSQSAAIHQAILDGGAFAISILSGRQEHVARYFADHSRPCGQEGFDVVGWSHGPNTGAPLIHGALGWLECAVAAAHDGGDHSIFVGSVLASDHGIARDALLFYGGSFHRSETS